MVILKINKMIDNTSETDLQTKLSDIIDADRVLSDISKGKKEFDLGYCTIVLNDERNIELGNLKIETPLSMAFDLAVSHIYYNKIYGKQNAYRDLVEECYVKLKKVFETPVTGWFKILSYYHVDENKIGVGINGSRLLLLNDPLKVDIKNAYSSYNPLGLDTTELKDEFEVFYYDRHLVCEVDQFVESTIISRPVNCLSLASFVEAFVHAHTELDVGTIITASSSLYGLMRNYDKDNSIETLDQELLIKVPRSFEGYARWFGYVGNIPLIDSPYCSYVTKDSTRDLSHIEFALLRNSGKITTRDGQLFLISGNAELPVSVYPTAIGTTYQDVDRIRHFTRFLTALYLQENFKVGENINLDLNTLFLIYTKNRGPILSDLFK